MRIVTVLAVLVAAATATAGVAVASVNDRLDASDEVARVLRKRDASFHYVAGCRNTSKTTFTCTWKGTSSRGVSADGRARVRKLSEHKYRATIMSFHRHKDTFDR